MYARDYNHDGGDDGDDDNDDGDDGDDLRKSSPLLGQSQLFLKRSRVFLRKF